MPSAAFLHVLRLAFVISFLNLGSVLICAQDAKSTQREAIDYFETHVRPLLIKNCLEGHSAETEASGGLLLESGPDWQAGGDSGKVLVAG